MRVNSRGVRFADDPLESKAKNNSAYQQSSTPSEIV